MENKLFLFCYLDNPSLFWLSLLEKAYAKLYNGYNNIKDLSVQEILYDLSSGFLDKFNFEHVKQKEQ